MEKGFEEAKIVEIREDFIDSVRRMYQLFPTKLCDDYYNSYRSLSPCIVLAKPNGNWP